MTVRTLLIFTGRAAGGLQMAAEQCVGEAVHVLSLHTPIDETQLPEGWEKLRVADFTNVERFRQEFRSFLDRWPRQPLSNGRSFDQLFRRRGGYSVWWTGPARDRHPERGTLPCLSALWVCDGAMRALDPQRIVVHTDDSALATLLSSRCRGRRIEFLRGSARPLSDPWTGGRRWLARSVARLSLLPFKYLIRACCVRLLQLRQPQDRSPASGRALIFVCELSRDIRTHRDKVSVWFWKEVRDALVSLDSNLACRYRVVYRKTSWLFHPAWRILTRLRGALPADERYAAIESWWRDLPNQLASLWRYARLERTREFRNSFAFAGADVSPLYVPQLRYAVARSVDWAQAVGAAAQSIATAGPVSAMLVVKEMYPSQLVTLAAARELGIPTIGVQHGSISPTHLMYTLPRGYIDGAPVPDYFAAYGEFARETVSVHGAYPAERVWITGGARFDHLVTSLPETTAARRRLELPPSARIVLITTQSYSWFSDVVRTVLAKAKDRSDWFVCIKTHPLRQQHFNLYSRIISEVGGSNARLFKDSFEDLLAACDVLISASSTTVLEAILAGRRTICVNFSAEPDQYPYAADGGSLPARSDSELRDALDRAFASEAQTELDRSRMRFLERHAGPAAEGRAAETLAHLVAELGGIPARRAVDQQT